MKRIVAALSILLAVGVAVTVVRLFPASSGEKQPALSSATPAQPPQSCRSVRFRELQQETPIPALRDGLVFAGIGTCGMDLYVINADGTGRTRLTRDAAWDTNPHWSPDGSKIAFESYGPAPQTDTFDFMLMMFNRDIYVLHEDGSLTNLSNDGRSVQPSWSPDGTKIAFVSWRDTIQGPEIYVMNAQGSDQVRLTYNEVRDDSPLWSPDGTKIAFVRHVRFSPYGDSGDIFVMNADGSGETRLTDNSRGNSNPSWSADGREIAFFSSVRPPLVSGVSTGTSEIYTIPSNGGTPVLVDRNPWGWARSPDGARIAYVQWRANELDIYVSKPDGSGELNLTKDGTGQCCPDWRPAAKPPNLR